MKDEDDQEIIQALRITAEEWKRIRLLVFESRIEWAYTGLLVYGCWTEWENVLKEVFGGRESEGESISLRTS